MAKLRAFGWAALGTGMLGLGSLPGARVPIHGDDFSALFKIYTEADGTAAGALTYGWRSGVEVGHFNPIGQALGALFHYGAFVSSVALGISPHVYDFLAGVGLLWFAVLSAAMVLLWGVRQSGATSTLTFWRAFALVATITAATIQLHPWSNDPVTTYAMAGWGSAAIGFALLGLALRSTMPGRTGATDVVVTGVLAVVAVLYYEMLVGMIAGTAVVYAGAALRARRRHDRPGLWRSALLSGVGVLLPAVVFIAGRLLSAASAPKNYDGTTLVIGRDALVSWWAAMVGAMPGGGWPYLIRMSGGLSLTPASLLFSAAFCVGVVLLVAVWSCAPRIGVTLHRSSWLVVAGVAGTWAATTATQTATLKYMKEITEPGQVYLYYGVTVVCVALLLSWGVVVLGQRTNSAARSGGFLLVGAFLVVQLCLNWHLATVSAVAFAPNRMLYEVALRSDVPPAERCQALLSWADRPWPDYYRDDIVKQVQAAYNVAYRQPLCPDDAVLDEITHLATG